MLAPLIKDLDDIVDKDNQKNYRPISNLKFVGKLIGSVVSAQLQNHMKIHNLNTNSQYGYKKDHSTETLLLRAVNDLLLNLGNNKPSILMLIDLSAAFDTVDQTKLLTILYNEIGVTGIAFKWFSSFLKGRTQRVKIRNTHSSESSLPYGVPQGSVLGPILFNIYTRSLCKYIKPTMFDIYGFADDHQLIKSFLPILQDKALGDGIQHCFQMISKWMSDYFLCINPNKTKILIISPPSLRETIVIQGTFIDSNCIRFVNSAKNLGVILDNDLSFDRQINSVVKSCFNTIRNLSKIRAFLTYEQLRTAVCACIFSKLDYCNSMYYGINSILINKLQSVQNSAARLLRRKEGLGNVSTTNYIKKHHWLCVRERIIFKICLLVHKCLHANAPYSLVILLSHCSSTRTLKLNLNSYKTGYGKRCFSRIGPKLWNLLPINIRMEINT